MTTEFSAAQQNSDTGSGSQRMVPGEETSEIPESVRSMTPESSHDTALPQLVPKHQSVSQSTRLSETSNQAGNPQIPRSAQYNHNPKTDSDHVHRRTGSTLKTVMRKIFTRKGRSQAGGPSNSLGHNPSGRRLDESTSVIKDPEPAQHPRQTSSIRSAEEVEDNKLEPAQQSRRATLPSVIHPESIPLEGLDGTVPPDSGSHDDCSQVSPRRSRAHTSRRRSRSASALRTSDRYTCEAMQRRSIDQPARLETVSDGDISSRKPSRSIISSAAEESVWSAADAEQEGIGPSMSYLVGAIQNDESASLEQRLAMLEVKLVDLEFAMARMQSQCGPSRRNKSRPEGSRVLEPGSRRARKQPPNHSPSTEASTLLPVLSETADGNRPSRIGSTVRPSTLSRSYTLQIPPGSRLPDYNSISVEQYSTLVTLLRQERSARRNLESLVSSLHDEIRQLQRVARNSMGIGTSVGVGTMYPIFSKDSHEFLASDRQHLGHSRSVSTSSTSPPDQRILQPDDSDSDWDYRQENLKRRGWESGPRIKVAGMI